MDNWAILVAGSKTYRNYRHQSDVFHAYQILLSRNISRDHIVLMAYDDIPKWSDNRFPGKVFNHPDGPNVYPGSSQIDYREGNVTAANFLAALSGDKTKAKGKVLQTTNESNIFVFFSDHGSPGLLHFPTGGGLHGSDLINTIKNMHQKNKYRRMMIYVEACYSGSIFKELPTDIDVIVMTAASPNENSWSCYCDEIGFGEVCLGDQLACAWMEHTEQVDPSTTPVGIQADYVQTMVDLSAVCLFGDTRLFESMIGEYQSSSSSSSALSSNSSPDLQSARTNKRQANEESGYKRLPSSFFPLPVIPSSLSLNESKRPEKKLARYIHAHPEQSLYQSFEQMNLSHFESTPQGLAELAMLRRRVERDPSPAAKRELAAAVTSIKRADDQTDKMYHYFANVLASRVNSTNTHNTTESTSEINSPSKSESFSFLLTDALVASDVPLYKKVLEVYEDVCGHADDYALIPHYRLLANVVSHHAITNSEQDLAQFREYLSTVVCSSSE